MSTGMPVADGSVTSRPCASNQSGLPPSVFCAAVSREPFSCTKDVWLAPADASTTTRKMAERLRRAANLLEVDRVIAAARRERELEAGGRVDGGEGVVEVVEAHVEGLDLLELDAVVRVPVERVDSGCHRDAEAGAFEAQEG